MALRRTQYFNATTGTLRSGETGHGESAVDLEQYLDPQDRLRTAASWGFGAATGLRVSVTAGVGGVRVSPGVALDATGRVIVLESGGVAIVDPDADPDAVLDIATVPVDGDGVLLPTAGPAADRVLTVTRREIQDGSTAAPVLLHAPWLRLVDPAGFTDDGTQVVLALVTLDAAGGVEALAPGLRRAPTVRPGRIELQAPRAGETVEQSAAGTLRARVDGALELRAEAGDVVVAGSGLSVDRGATDAVGLSLTSSGPGWGSGLRWVNSAAGGRTYGAFSGADGRWHLTDVTAGDDRLVVDPAGRVGIGVPTPSRIVHAEGTEIHSGGSAGGLSFADRTTGGFVESPTAGERWVWYASGGQARLWSGRDRLSAGIGNSGDALDVRSQMRVRQGDGSSAGIWLFQTTPGGDRAFVGMADDNRVGFRGNTGAEWGLTMNTTSGDVALTGDLQLPKTGDGMATFSHEKFLNESALTRNNLKLDMGSTFVTLGPDSLRFEFMVGYRRLFFNLVTHERERRFVRVFGVDQDGHAFFAAGKGGYVVDYFVNGVGETLERGDVVVLSSAAPPAYYGTHDAIPVPEVDLTDQAYDGRVCGVVCDVVSEGSLPSVDPASEPSADEPYVHPLARFAGGSAEDSRTAVPDQRMGRMVTLGAWAYCKVDADAAPIETGDPLTTSATRGHAQKVTDRAAGTGAMIGKAMAPLASGRGMIPIMVALQ